MPWDEYRRDRLRAGMSYPVGRDLVELALREAGAAVGSLAFVVPTAGHPRAGEPQNIIEIFWYGRARARRLANASLPPADALLMRVWAVNSTHRHDVADLLRDALPAACRWIAAALARDPAGAWSTADHELTVRYANAAVTIHES
ncbi:hypothetical protein [Actinoplanes sp. NPDC023714]|uniref:hypothetical protein n=1 Tax=Actinoplanes sp. NPDC023714 TaxID=3154322 RepID=UPI0033D26C37